MKSIEIFHWRGNYAHSAISSAITYCDEHIEIVSKWWKDNWNLLISSKDTHIEFVQKGELENYVYTTITGTDQKEMKYIKERLEEHLASLVIKYKREREDSWVDWPI